MKKIKITTYLWLVLSCLPFWGTAQTHLVNENHLVSSGGFIVFANSQLTNNGTINHSAGSVKMMGDAMDANSAIGGTTAPTFNTLTISKTANNVPLAQNITVNGTLTMEGGHLDLQSADLTTNTITGAMASRYIKTSGTGQLKQQVSDSEVNFPVGNTSFNPAKIINSGTADLIGIRIADQVLENLTSGDAIADASVNRVWHTSEAVAGGSNLAVNVQWNGAEELSNFDRSQSTFTSFENGAWAAKNSGAATGSNPYTHTGTGITTLDGFSIANIVCELNGLATLGITPPNAGTDQLDICGSGATLSAAIPGSTTGIWSFAPTSTHTNATFDDMSNIASALTGVFGGLYTLRWTVADGACATIFDEVKVAFNPDEDLPGGLPDGVQDCVDICLGGDDTQNTDGFGAPDDCDCDLEDDQNEFVDFNDPELALAVQDANLFNKDTIKPSADFEMTSVGTIAAKNSGTYPTVIMRGGNSVQLLPGFHAQAGSDFIAKVEYCKDPLTGQPNLLPVADPTKQSLVLPVPTNILGAAALSVQPTITNQHAFIRIDLPIQQAVTLSLHNQHGQKVATFLEQDWQEKGVHAFELNAQALPSGIYFLRLQGKATLLTEKVVVAR